MKLDFMLLEKDACPVGYANWEKQSARALACIALLSKKKMTSDMANRLDSNGRCYWEGCNGLSFIASLSLLML